MHGMAPQITRVQIVYSAVCSGADKRKHQGLITRKTFPLDDVIMKEIIFVHENQYENVIDSECQ